jgi:hypothetical protein
MVIHDRSKKLENFENDKLIQLIERENAQIISSGIIQLFTSENFKISDGYKWTKFSPGIICLIKYLNTNGYYFVLLDLKPSLLWKHTLNCKYSYKRISNFFYAFHANKTVGFNFSFEDEANKFYSLMTNCSFIDITNAEKMTKKANNIQAHVGTIKRSITINTSDIPELFRKSTKFFRAEKKKIKKSDIQCPISDTFVRINHIGLSNNNNFVVNMNQKNEHFTMILEVLEKLDIKPNKQSLSYVDKVIQSCGGYKQMYDSYSHYKIQKTRTTLSPLMNKQVERIEKTRHSKPFAPIKPACNEEDFKRSLTENKSVLKIVQTLENRPPSQSSLASSNLEVAKTDETVTECNIYLCQSPKSNFNKDDNNNIKQA